MNASVNVHAASKYGNLSMKNIMIHKKLDDKRTRFDSADWAMQTNKLNGTAHNNSCRRPPDSPKKSSRKDLQINTAATMAVPVPCLSPAQIGVRTFCEGLADSSMEEYELVAHHKRGKITDPVMDSSNSLSPRSRINVDSVQRNGKYGTLGMQSINSRGTPTPRKQSDTRLSPANTDAVCSSQINCDVDMEISGESSTCTDTRTSSSHSNLHKNLLLNRVQATVNVSNSTYSTSPRDRNAKYGKLCATNILIRKKLKEKKLFDSADYSMESSAQKSSTKKDSTQETTFPSTPTSSNQSGAFMGANIGRDINSPSARIAARNIFLQRKLAERKRFDSGDHFANIEMRKHHPAANTPATKYGLI